MCRHFKVLMVVSLALISMAKAQQTKHPFKVYGFVVYGGYVKDGNNVNASYKDIQLYLAHLGVMKYDLIYENKMLDYTNGDKLNGIVNQYKMDSLSSKALGNADVLVSLDLEGWKRFDTVATPTRMLAAIAAFRKQNKKCKIGLYATVPQNTYGYDDKISRYDKWNRGYAKVAAAIDYFSPSLYNYKTTDSIQWKKAAIYNVEACRKYGFPDKKIIPYVTPEVTADSKTTLLTYDEMMFRLQTLYNLGADGCLIWTSSGSRDAAGKRIYINENEGWLKAVKDFVAMHAER